MGVRGRPGLLFPLEPGLASSCHRAGDGVGGRVGPVSVGVRKRGKPSQWKLPCGWLRRPQHCIYRELPATLEFFTVELTLSEPRCQPGVEGRNTGLRWDSWIATGLGANSLEDGSGQWPVTCPLSPKKKLWLLEVFESVWGMGSE